MGERPSHLLCGNVIDQSVYFRITQLVAEGRHKRAAELDSDSYISAAWFSVAERKFLVFEKAIQAGTEFSCVFLIFVNVVADGAVFAKKIASCDQR